MKTLRDSWLIFVRTLFSTLRNPVWIAIGLLQPVLYLTLFGPLLKRVVTAQGFPSGGAMNVFVPGLIVQMALFGSAFVGFSLIAEMRWGFIERLSVTPTSPVSILLGHALRDVVVLTIQAMVLIVIAIRFGLSISVSGLAMLLVLIALLAFSMASLSYATALKLKDEDAFAPFINTVAFPMMLLAGILLPMSLAPHWLKTVSKFNPLSYAVDASRAMANGNLGASEVWIGLGVMAAACVVTAVWAARSFQNAAE